MQEMWVWSLGWEDPLEKGTATDSCSCLGNPTGRGAWQATVDGAIKSRAQLSDQRATANDRNTRRPSGQPGAARSGGGGAGSRPPPSPLTPLPAHLKCRCRVDCTAPKGAVIWLSVFQLHSSAAPAVTAVTDRTSLPRVPGNSDPQVVLRTLAC